VAAAPWAEADLPAVLAAGAARLRDLGATRLSVPLPGGQAEFVSWGFYETRPWRNWSHAHSFYEVCLSYAGVGTFASGDRDFAISEGMLFLARPGDVHEIRGDGDDPLGITYWGFTLPHRSETPDWLAGFTDPEGPVVVTDTESVELALRMMVRAVESGGPRSDVRTQSVAQTLLAETASAFATAPAEGTPSTDSGEAAVQVMRRYLEDNLARPVRVRDLAAQVHLSERHAARLFRVATGETVGGYLRRQRCTEAAARLLVPGASIGAVGKGCGFFDRHHFIRTFRSQYGVSPSEYQRRFGTTFTD
jgi:AraC-like DNA-binding protein/quercetin dioxygenase-like cupin family protein